MKVNRMISIELEINQKLAEVENASRLISNLLINYFDHQDNPKSQKQMEVVYDRK